MPRKRNPPQPKWLKQLVKYEDLARTPAVLVAQMFCVLLGLALVALSLAGMWGAWDQTTTTRTTGTNPAVVTATAMWSDARVATLLGTGLVLVLAGVFFNRITAITLPGGGGISMAAASALTADVVEAMIKKALQNAKLQRPGAAKAVVYRTFDELTTGLNLGGVVNVPVVGGTVPHDSYHLANLRYMASPDGNDPTKPDTLAEIAVDKAITDLHLE